MAASKDTKIEGGCACGAVTYRLTAEPLFVHCCHCRHCQRENGSAFALNALIETSHVELLSGVPKVFPVPSESGKGQKFVRCPDCAIALWSYYSGAGEKISFIRVGTLKDPDQFSPDIHIFTESKQPWVVVPEDLPSYPRFYKWADEWPAASLERRERVLQN